VVGTYGYAAQFIIMYIGFGLLLIFSIIHFGSPVNLINHLPESHKTLFGNSSWQYILAWFIIALQTFIDPSFHQRASAAKSPQIAQKGVLISIACWVVFDTFTLLTGFYAKAYFQIDNPVMAYPILGDAVLPHLFKGIFVASLLATIMSTLDSYALISAATIGNDILGKFRRSKFYNIDVENSSSIKFGLILTGLIGISMAVVIPSIIELVYKTASIAVPALLIPLIVSYSQKFYLKAKKARLMMLISGGLSFLFTIYDILLEKTGNLVQDRLFNIEPMMPGIIISFILGLFFIKRK
jgi:SSS family solute:Na+ symporter